MPNMSLKASEISDPLVLVERVAYRTQRLLDKIDEKPNPAAFVHLMAGHELPVSQALPHGDLEWSLGRRWHHEGPDFWDRLSPCTAARKTPAAARLRT